MLQVFRVRSHKSNMDEVADDIETQVSRLVEQHKAHRLTPLLNHVQCEKNDWFTASLVVVLEGPPPEPPLWLRRMFRLNSAGRPYTCHFTLKDGTELYDQAVYGFDVCDREIKMATFDTAEPAKTVRVADVLTCKVEVLD